MPSPLLNSDQQEELRSSMEGRFLKLEINIPRGGLKVFSVVHRAKTKDELERKSDYPTNPGPVWHVTFLDVASDSLKHVVTDAATLVNALQGAGVMPGDTIELTKKKDKNKNVFSAKVLEKTTDESQAAFLTYTQEKVDEDIALQQARVLNAEPFA